jgi:uncharacterized membrane protein YfcA
VSPELLALSAITLIAAAINGALGYGFSSLTVPMALLMFSNRVLNPALVLIEVVLNAYVLLVNRRSVPAVWRRMLPIMAGLAPGVALGTIFVASLNPTWMKLWTFACLIPLIFVQAAGFRRPIRGERRVGFLFGSGVGTLYAVTTISGPPLALMLNNQGYVKQEFRAGLGLVRLAESTMTAAAYLYAGMFTTTSLALSLQIVPSLVIGVPLGAILISRVQPEVFRRVCMSFDVWIVAFGLTSVLRLLGLVDWTTAGALFFALASFDVWLLTRFFRQRRDGLAVATDPVRA